MKTALKTPPQESGCDIKRRLTIEDVEQIEAALADGMPSNEIAKLTGVGNWTVNLIAKQKHWLQHKRVAKAAAPIKRRAAKFKPTPDEIAMACAAIRRGRNQESIAMLGAAERMGLGRSASEGGEQ
ncbi:MAG TPA: hypothetical protein VFG14_12810 [Chthoniobacteraceae bacterium]|nr:hypothetical protein [Chthoniobacteraceae bacterium]